MPSSAKGKQHSGVTLVESSADPVTRENGKLLSRENERRYIENESEGSINPR